jgi:hypothetical protein
VLGVIVLLDNVFFLLNGVSSSSSFSLSLVSQEEDMDEGEKVEHRMALKKAKLRRLRLSEQAKFRDACVTLREAVRKADVLDTGYLSVSDQKGGNRRITKENWSDG